MSNVSIYIYISYFRLISGRLKLKRTKLGDHAFLHLILFIIRVCIKLFIEIEYICATLQKNQSKYQY